MAAIGHKDAYYYAEELVKENKKLTEREILDIHSLVLMDRAGAKGKW